MVRSITIHNVISKEHSNESLDNRFIVLEAKEGLTKKGLRER